MREFRSLNDEGKATQKGEGGDRGESGCEVVRAGRGSVGRGRVGRTVREEAREEERSVVRGWNQGEGRRSSRNPRQGRCVLSRKGRMPQRRDIGRAVEVSPWPPPGQVAQRHPGICTSRQIAVEVFCTAEMRPAGPRCWPDPWTHDNASPSHDIMCFTYIQQGMKGKTPPAFVYCLFRSGHVLSSSRCGLVVEQTAPGATTFCDGMYGGNDSVELSH